MRARDYWQLGGAVLAVAAMNVACRPTCMLARTVGDPSARYTYAVHETRYDQGAASAGLYFQQEVPDERTLSINDENEWGDIEGSVWYPAKVSGSVTGFVYTTNTEFAATPGPVPIVFIMQGRLASNAYGYLGYSSLQAALAQAGIIAVSVRMDLVDQGLAGTIQNETDWAKRLLANMYYFGQENGTSGSVFKDKIDFTRIGLIGHSHGGLAVMKAPDLIDSAFAASDNDWQVKALMTLGTNYLSPYPPAGIPFMTILPANEGGYTGYSPPFPTGAPGFPEVPGARLYDQVEPAPFKALLYVHGADHQSFNRKFPSDGRPDTLGRREHEMILRAYGSAFFQAFLLDLPSTGQEAFLKRSSGPMAYLNGKRYPHLFMAASPSTGQYGDINVDVSNLVQSWKSQFSLTIEDHEDGSPTSNTQGGAVSSVGLDIEETEGSAGESYAGETRLVLASQLSCTPSTEGSCTGYLRSELPARLADLSGRSAILVRVAEVIKSTDVATPTGVALEVGLESASGEVSYVPADRMPAVPRPYFRNDPATQRWVMTTLRIPLHCFSPVFRGMFLQNIRAIRLRPLAETGRKMAFDDLQLE